MDVEIVTGARGTTAILRKDGQLVAVVSVLNESLKVRELSALIADDTSASIRDRCYSLVQSIARLDTRIVSETVLDEASQICADAGWK